MDTSTPRQRYVMNALYFLTRWQQNTNTYNNNNNNDDDDDEDENDNDEERKTLLFGFCRRRKNAMSRALMLWCLSYQLSLKVVTLVTRCICAEICQQQTTQSSILHFCKQPHSSTTTTTLSSHSAPSPTRNWQGILAWLHPYTRMTARSSSNGGATEGPSTISRITKGFSATSHQGFSSPSRGYCVHLLYVKGLRCCLVLHKILEQKSVCKTSISIQRIHHVAKSHTSCQ